MSDHPDPEPSAPPHDATAAAPALSATVIRDSLVEAGLKLFAAQGYEATSPQVLAAVAGVNPAAIPFYFGGKEGVYLAVVQRLLHQLAPRLQALIGRLDAALMKVSSPVMVAPLLEAFAAGQLEIIHALPEAAFLFREQFRPSLAFDLLYRDWLEPAHRFNTRLLALLLQKAADDPETVLLEQALSGVVGSFVQNRATWQRRLEAVTEHGMTEMDCAATATVRAVRHLVRYMIQGALLGRQGTAGVSASAAAQP